MIEYNEMISVVVPVYNVEDYLTRCVASIIKSTYNHLEILLIDDGSIDTSGKLCDVLARTDSRIQVFHKANGGLSDARNYGTKRARGTYITYVDSDDTISSTMIEYLYSLIIKYNTPMSVCSHTIVKSNGKKIFLGNNQEEVLSSEQCLEKMLYHDMVDTSAWAKLYKTDMALSTPYPKGKWFEDIGTTYKFFIKSKKIACGYRSLYQYYTRNDSIVHQKFSDKKIDLLLMTDEMAKNVLEKFPSLKDAVLRRRIYARFSTLNQMLDLPSFDLRKRKIIEFIKTYGNRKFLENKRVPLRDKIAIILLKISPRLYNYCWKLYMK